MMEMRSMPLLCAIVIACLSPGCKSFSIIMPSTMTCTATRGTGRFTFSPPPLFLMDGLFDYVRDNFFLDSRQDDFVPLVRDDDADDAFGPGPLLLLYAVPETMLDDDELRDMIEDGMPNRRIRGGGASSSNVVIRRITGISETNKGVNIHCSDEEFLDLSVEEALKRAMSSDKQQQSGSSSTILPAVATTPTVSKAADNSMEKHRIVDISPSPLIQHESSTTRTTPVLYFSGVTNTEMMDTYKIIANEIYAEMAGKYWPACAKAVPAAMKKPLRRVIGEISGDHADAMKNSGQDYGEGRV